MNISWEISESDISKIAHFVDEHKNPMVENRMNRNVYKKNIQIDRDTILMTMLTCLLTSRQDSGPDSKIGIFFSEKPFVLTYPFLSRETNIKNVLHDLLKTKGLTRYIRKIPDYFAFNFYYLEDTKWKLQVNLENCLKTDMTKSQERELADGIDQMFKGFGSKQARNFLQSLGLTKYEIPIDSRTMNWLKDFGFSITFSPIALQDTAFYHFISDGIQLLCEKAGIYPCILDAVIVSSKEEMHRTKEK